MDRLVLNELNYLLFVFLHVILWSYGVVRLIFLCHDDRADFGLLLHLFLLFFLLFRLLLLRLAFLFLLLWFFLLYFLFWLYFLLLNLILWLALIFYGLFFFYFLLFRLLFLFIFYSLLFSWLIDLLDLSNDLLCISFLILLIFDKANTNFHALFILVSFLFNWQICLEYLFRLFFRFVGDLLLKYYGLSVIGHFNLLYGELIYLFFRFF